MEELECTCGHCGHGFRAVPEPKHRLLCGDSTKAEDVARLMGGERANLVVSDPPYGVDYVGKTKDALRIENDEKNGLGMLLEAAFKNAFDSCMDGACWYVAAPAGPQFFDFAKVLLDLEIWRQTLVWAKQTLVMGHSDYHYQHEVLFYGWKPGAAHHEPPDRKQTSLWSIDRPTASREHPTMKPVALFAKAIANSSNAEDLVFDPFLGSSTTIIACEQLGRRCFGVEISPAYAQVGLERWAKLTGKQPILEATGETLEDVTAVRGNV